MGKRNFRVAAVAAVSVAALAAPALAGHRWSTYHWNRPSGQVSVDVGDNVSSTWDSYLQIAMNGAGSASKRGWNFSEYIQGNVVAGATNPKNCRAVSGTIQVCSNRYGFTGWLGIASIWTSGGHIVQGTTKVNDSYFNTATYNKPEWRRMVMCQEIGHDYGLGHVNETFNDPNTGSCMDYTNNPAGGGSNGTLSNEYPNDHDFDELATIYTDHVDSAAATNFAVRAPGRAVAAASPGLGDGIPGDSPAEWGRAVHSDGNGRPDIFVMDIGNGVRKITHVFWTLEARRGEHHD